MNFDETYPATVNSVSTMRAELTEFLSGQAVAEETIESVRLAASEAANNVVLHAYRDTETPGQLEVASCVDDGQVQVAVVDHGGGFTVRRDSPGLGLGLSIIARLVDSVELLNRADGFEIRMRFWSKAA